MKEANAASLKCTKKKIWEKNRTAKIKGQIKKEWQTKDKQI
jgi:hypothetical protein